MTRAVVVPHAPLLLPEVSPAASARAGATRRALAALDLTACDTVVVVSGHGRGACVYAVPSGDLSGFSVAGVALERAGDRALGRELARAWGRAVEEGPADFGVVVPLLAGFAPHARVVGVALPETSGPDGAPFEVARREAHALARALGEVVGDGVAVAFSAHTAAALSPRAPLTERPVARAAEEALLEAARRSLGECAELIDAWQAAGDPCGARPLTALVRWRPQARLEVRSYEAPFGVGYLVAEVAG